MAESVTPEYLLKGAVYALELCGILLHDAALLYRGKAYASAVVLAAFAREALGQWRILLEARKEAIAGSAFTLADIKARCGNHVEKQKAGMLSLTMQPDRDTGAGRLIMSRITAVPGTEEWKKTDEALAQIHRRMKREVPTKRHEQRELALYVDPIEPLTVDRWNRPSIAITKGRARDFIEDARNDYAIQARNLYNNFDVLREVDEELCRALGNWSDRPTLPLPLPEGSLPL